MPAWICPNCQRQFSRRNQSHECAPAMSLDEYFASGPAHERPIFDAVMAHMAGVGPVRVEPVSVGLFLKRSGGFAELRPRDKWVNLSFKVRHPVDSPRIRSRMKAGAGATYVVVRLHGPGDVDDEVCGWLTEAYLDSPA